MSLWQITANVATVSTLGATDNPWTGCRQVPIFYLDSDMQGIISEEHAVRVARQVIDPLGVIPPERIHVIVGRVPSPLIIDSEPTAEYDNRS